ncbi:MAG: cell division protein FtsA, partial [Candidatus Thioglobus sp.]|nr:cell division protein FtsA [Candidatus Thioglobus sp.]
LLAEEVGGRLEVFGHALGESAGVKKGVIADVELAAGAIKKGTRRADSGGGFC